MMYLRAKIMNMVFLGDPAKQEAPQEETAFVCSAVYSFVRAHLSSNSYNSASLRPTELKF